jgi:hypothetical protein
LLIEQIIISHDQSERDEVLTVGRLPMPKTAAQYCGMMLQSLTLLDNFGSIESALP